MPTTTPNATPNATPAAPPATPTSPDYAAITGRQREMWATGDFHVVALTVIPVAQALVDAAAPRPGRRVLDVACGSGNCALVAARRHCEVTGVDFVPSLLDRARRRASAEGTQIDFREGDAQRLPFPDRSFDVVLSSFGVMFAANQEQAARELLRVCRPGGRIALANWTPSGFGGAFVAAVAKHAPPPPGLKPPTRWGTLPGLRELLGEGTRSITTTPRTIRAYFLSMEHAMETFRTWFGPTRRAFESLNTEGRRSLTNDLTALFSRYNRAADDTLEMEYDYLEVVATVK
jgi:ubiquinone/menaquinone biosynthesis C-methylase UbiE